MAEPEAEVHIGPVAARTPATSMAALAITAWGSSAIANALATPSPIAWVGGLTAWSCARTPLRPALYLRPPRRTGPRTAAHRAWRRRSMRPSRCSPLSPQRPLMHLRGPSPPAMALESGAADADRLRGDRRQVEAERRPPAGGRAFQPFASPHRLGGAAAHVESQTPAGPIPILWMLSEGAVEQPRRSSRGGDPDTPVCDSDRGAMNAFLDGDQNLRRLSST